MSDKPRGKLPPVYKEQNHPQLTLIDEPTNWEREWQGMPEFVQEKQEAFSTIIVRLRCKEDLEAFAELVGQQHITVRTTSIWYPQLEFQRSTKRWVDES